MKIIDDPTARSYKQSIDKWYRFEEAIGDTRDATCIDLGAHYGITACRMAEIGCRVYAYEPDLQNCEKLHTHIAMNFLEHRIKVYQEAVWDSSGIGLLSLDASKHNQSHTLSGTGLSRLIYSGKTEEVKTVTPEEIFERVKGPIPYLKVNCEGGEYFVLKYLANHEEDARRVQGMGLELHPDLLGLEWMEECVNVISYLRGSGILKMKILVAYSFTETADLELVNKLRGINDFGG